MWNFGYHFARAKGAAIRRRYAARLATPHPDIRQSLDLDVFSYSGEAMLPEQVASIRSFLKYAGRPVEFHVVSDGTHSERAISLLTGIDSCVRFHSAPLDPLESYPALFQKYLREHPTGRQLSLIMSLPRSRPALYVDSDVLFFDGARCIGEIAKAAAAPAFYLQDCQFSGDDRLLEDPGEKAHPLNTGFLMLHRPLDWTIAAQRFDRLQQPPTFFTNQTLTHLTMHAHHAVAFDPRQFVLQLDDQFVFADQYAGSQIALRHYVNPVRHKFWTSLDRSL